MVSVPLIGNNPPPPAPEHRPDFNMRVFIQEE